MQPFRWPSWSHSEVGTSLGRVEHRRTFGTDPSGGSIKCSLDYVACLPVSTPKTFSSQRRASAPLALKSEYHIHRRKRGDLAAALPVAIAPSFRAYPLCAGPFPATALHSVEDPPLNGRHAAGLLRQCLLRPQCIQSHPPQSTQNAPHPALY